MQHIWTAFLPILSFAALASAIQRELENTDKHDWYWIIKQQPGVLGVSVKFFCFHGLIDRLLVGLFEC